MSLYRSRGRPRQTRYASNYRRSDENQTRPTERKYKGLKHSQQDERQNHYYRHDSYHHRGISNKNIVDSIDIFINGVKLPFVESAKYLGVEIDSKLSCSNHIDGLCKKLSSQLYILRRLKQIPPTDDINCDYYGIFQSIIDYCITVWGSAARKYLCKIQKLQNRAARLLAQNFDWNIRGIDIVRRLGWQNVKERYFFYHVVSLINL